MKDIFIEAIEFFGCVFISCLACGILIGLAVKINDWFGPEDDPDGDLMSIVFVLTTAFVTLLTAICMEVIK